jgi:DNA-binding Lrp family transcriptional regulator
MTQPVDALDAQLMQLFADEPRVGVLEASRRIGVARGTVQARLDRLAASGVITGWGPQVNPTALGHPVTAFLTLQIRQGAGPDQATAHEAVAQHLAGVPEVLEAYTITGAGDLWCRCVARSNADLQRVIDEVVAHPGVERTSTVIALATQIEHRVLPLVHQVAREAAPRSVPAAPLPA